MSRGSQESLNSPTTPNMSDSIQAFVIALLAKPPGPPHSVQLEIDTEDGVVAMFEVLITVMTSILKAWYAPPIHIGSIAEEDVGRLVAYFASFSIQLDLDVREEPRVYRIDNRAYQYKTRLEDMLFQMSGEGKLYTVRFRSI
jgi:hypothetical protein